MEDNHWDLSIFVNGPNNGTISNLSLASFENDVNTFDKKFSTDMPNLKDLAEIFSIDFLATLKGKLGDQVIIMDQNNNQDMNYNPIKKNQIIQ